MTDCVKAEAKSPRQLKKNEAYKPDTEASFSRSANTPTRGLTLTSFLLSSRRGKSALPLDAGRALITFRCADRSLNTVVLRLRGLWFWLRKRRRSINLNRSSAHRPSDRATRPAESRSGCGVIMRVRSSFVTSPTKVFTHTTDLTV